MRPSHMAVASVSEAGRDNMDFAIGDVVKLNANRGALLVENKDQRIYQCQLGISDNNVETASPLLANDFYGKFVDA